MIMSLPLPDSARIHAAYERVCRILLDRQTSEGYWIGRLSDSALSTATAVSALTVFRNSAASKHDLTAEEFEQLDTLIQRGADWILAHQNPDGGWGDTDKSFSNVSTTLLVKSALTLVNVNRVAIVRLRDTAQSYDCGSVFAKADEYLHRAGGIDAIKKRYGNDQTFSVPILTNAALAGLTEWKDIPQLPFELAALPMSWFRFVKMNVVSYAVPALVAIGQVRFHFFQEKGKFIGNFFRRLVKKRTLRLIQDMQPESGGYLEAAPLTSFVVMSLSAMGLTDHPIVTKGIRFLLQTVRDNGSWAIDTNLATWLTSLSMTALQFPRVTNVAQSSRAASVAERNLRVPDTQQTIDWLLSCQHKQRHPFTGALPGGWGWTNLSGAVPDADDTAAALLALVDGDGTLEAAVAGINWLLKLQNRDGGMPTFCQGWGMLPFDQSSTDITAHVIRAFQVHRAAIVRLCNTAQSYDYGSVLVRMQRAEERMYSFLERTQQKNGAWFPLWFGNQSMPDDVNPYYGTAKVLLALAETKKEHVMTFNGLRYLIASQNVDGSWGNSVEETAVVVEALSLYVDRAEVAPAYDRGLNWLLEAVESDRFLQSSPIGLYFAKLWYYEDLYPIIFTASALRRALLPKETTERS